MSEKQIDIAIIEREWAKDSKIDITDISLDSSRQLELHQKYHKVLNHVKARLRNIQAEKTRLLNLKYDYYTNALPPQQLSELGWKPNKRLVLKEDIKRVLEADEDIIEINLNIGDMNDMIDFLDSIIKSIYQKPFIVKNIIEDRKFVNGIN